MPKVLISDKLDTLAVEIFEKNGVEVDFKPGLSPEEQLQIIDQYDGLAIRSSTTVTAEMIAKATNLKVIGRAGIGVDNIDIPAATAAGICVMNTPFGNSITTAEHAIAMMFALARQIPQANESTHAGKWEKKRFMGTELYSKTLGVIGCGNIGGIVADRALGLKMKVIAFDPFLSDERAKSLSVEKVDLDTLFSKSDFITIHVPKNEKTAGLINKDSLALMKDGVNIINCARGGIIIETDLKDALDSGKVAGAALDVFEIEPAKENSLFGHERVVCTPHLGAATTEAQVNVALQVAEQLSDYLVNGAVTNALNMPSISAEDAPRLQPYVKLAAQMGELTGQMPVTDAAMSSLEIEYFGDITSVNTDPITSTIVASVLKSQLSQVNMVNALQVAEARGIDIKTSYHDNVKNPPASINITMTCGEVTHNVSGSLFSGQSPRIVNIDGVPVEAGLSQYMLCIHNDDTPGFIGRLGALIGEAGYNISDFRLGRLSGGGHAVAMVSLDAQITDDVFADIKSLDQVNSAARLNF